MAKFDAATVVEALEWTFEPHVKGASGVIKEPSDRQVTTYIADLKKLMTEVREKVPNDIETADVGVMMAAVEDLDPEIVVSFHDKLAGVYAALCSGTPSKATILKLPMRIRTIFYAWLQQEVMAPEAVPGATTR